MLNCWPDVTMLNYWIRKHCYLDVRNFTFDVNHKPKYLIPKCDQIITRYHTAISDQSVSQKTEYYPDSEMLINVIRKYVSLSNQESLNASKRLFYKVRAVTNLRNNDSRKLLVSKKLKISLKY